MRDGARTCVAGLLVSVLLLGFASVFGLVAVAGAGELQTDPPPSEPAPPEPLPPRPPLPSPPPRTTIADGVLVGGVPVGGLLPSAATRAVRASFERPLVLVVGPVRRVRVMPRALGARPKLEKAVARARAARPGARVPLEVEISRERVRRYVARLARELDRPAVDARARVRGLELHVSPAKPGRRLQRVVTARAIRAALTTGSREPIVLRYRKLAPEVTEAEAGTAIVIFRESKQLRFYLRGKLVRTFRVATGAPSYPTPLGVFEITTMQRSPWWYPPPSPWASGKAPVPPGPRNPLGTRWMGISAPYVGIHGTPDAASIGYSVSHGCVRMRIPDAEWLFERVRVGTPVFIVPR